MKIVAVQDHEEEAWRLIPDVGGRYVRYEVSSLGRVRSIRIVVMAPYVNQKRAGYDQLGFLQLGRRTPKAKLVHTLVAAAFLGPRPPGYVICHNDGNRRNNRASNLRYDTYASNSADRKVHGTNMPGASNPNAVLCESQVKAIRGLKGRLTYRQIAAEYEVCYGTIQKIMSRETWVHV